jgi:hypothetical protein
MARLKDVNWNLAEGTPNAEGGRSHNIQSIHAALLMDLRDQAQEQTRLQREQLHVLKRMDRRMQQLAKLPPGKAPR